MKKLILLILSLILITPLAYAEKPHGPKATEVNISVGTEDGQMKFTPESLTFKRGTYYKLVISNPSVTPVKAIGTVDRMINGWK